MPLASTVFTPITLEAGHVAAGGYGREILPVHQDAQLWCWAACIQMVTASAGQPARPQCEIARLALGLPECCGPGADPRCATTLPLAIDDVATPPHTSMELVLRQLGLSARYCGTALADDDLVKALARGPVLVGMRTAFIPGHVVVVVDWREGSFRNPWLLVNDPHNDPPSQHVIQYLDLRGGWHDTIIFE